MSSCATGGRNADGRDSTQISFSRTEGQGRTSSKGWCGMVSWAGTGWRFFGSDVRAGIEVGRTCK